MAEVGREPVGGVRTAAILGLGLMGGSLARDLAARGWRVLGFDCDPKTVKAALEEGCIQGVLGEDGAGGSAGSSGVLEEADVVVLALPIGVARRALADLAPRLCAARLVTDVGSTKRSVVAAAEALGLGPRFVGSHPLAGDHRSGWKASRPGLFRGARVFLSPARDAGPVARALAEELWRSVGADPEVMSAAEHDRRMAWVSHLPHAAASALAVALADSGYGATELGPGGRDTTRLAASSPSLWADLLLDNADEVEPALRSFEEAVRALRTALGRRDSTGVARTLAAARAWKEASLGQDAGPGGQAEPPPPNSSDAALTSSESPSTMRASPG